VGLSVTEITQNAGSDIVEAQWRLIQTYGRERAALVFAYQDEQYNHYE